MDCWWRRGSPLILVAVVVCGCLFAVVTSQESASIIGIDLGSTYSRVGVYKNGRVEIIPNDQGNPMTPSWVAFTNGEKLIGEAAKNQAAVNQENTIFDFRRFIGRKFRDEEVQFGMKLVPYKIVNKDDKPYIQIDIKDGSNTTTRVFSPKEVTAMFLTKMKEIAEAFLGENIKYAIVTLPAYFNDNQRQAITDAGVIAGLEVLRVTDEPRAAAMAYGLEEKGRDVDMKILVYDLGGGKFDAGVLTFDDGRYEILSTNGNTNLGGEVFDLRVMDYFVNLIKKKHGKDITKDKQALEKLRIECERAKIALSNQDQVRMEIKSLYDGLNFSEPLTRAKFEELNDDLFRRTLQHVQQAIEDAELEKNQIDEIILAGGSSRIPKVQQILRDYFQGKEPIKGLEQDEVVAYGAALMGRDGPETYLEHMQWIIF